MSKAWNITESAYAKNQREDAQTTKLENDLRRRHADRAGRPVNDAGWAWCAACGAVNVPCSEHESVLVKGRAAGLCPGCVPGDLDFEALAMWRAMSAEARVDGLYQHFAHGYGAKQIPEYALDCAATHLLAGARESGARAVRDGIYLSNLDFALLCLGTEADKTLARAAVAAVKARLAEVRS